MSIPLKQNSLKRRPLALFPTFLEFSYFFPHKSATSESPLLSGANQFPFMIFEGLIKIYIFFPSKIF